MKINIPNINLNNFQLFTLFGFFWIGLGWLSLLLSLFNIFYSIFFIIYFILWILASIYIAFLNKRKLEVDYGILVVVILSLFTIFIFSHYTTPTIFSGRDQGSLSEAAIRLSQNHQLEFSSTASHEFFKIYGPGKALNFSGFNYTNAGNLITQFPLGYISWLAIFYSLFGLSGLVIANGVTFFIFLISFYLIARHYIQKSSALVAFFLVLTSFIFSWFFKFTLSENLALALVWFGIYEFILFTQHRKRFYLLASLLSFALLLFARVEAVAFLAIIIAILLIKYRDWKYLIFVVIGKKILLTLLGIALIYLFNLTVNIHFYTALAKGTLGSFISFGNNVKNSTNIFSSFLTLMKIFMLYGLFNYLALGVAGIFLLIKQKRFSILLPFLIVSPSFIYLINPSISNDHPWMLRRFVFAIIPVCIFYTVFFLDWFFKKRIYFYLLIVLLAGTNLLVFIPFLQISPNKNLLPQVEDLSKNFLASDLILVDREATGDGWSMITGPMNFLYEKQAIYFFNPKDLSKINLNNFSNIYFIIPDNNLDLYRDSNILEKLTPQNIDSMNIPDIYGKIYLYRQ